MRLAYEPSLNLDKPTPQYYAYPISAPSLSPPAATASNATWTLTGQLRMLTRRHAATWSPWGQNLLRPSIIYTSEPQGSLRSNGHSQKLFAPSPTTSTMSKSHV